MIERIDKVQIYVDTFDMIWHVLFYIISSSLQCEVIKVVMIWYVIGKHKCKTSHYIMNSQKPVMRRRNSDTK